MRSSARSECVKSLIKLKREEEIIEKTLDHFFDNMKLEPETLRALTNERNSRMLDRRKLENSLRGSILDIAKCLTEIKIMIKDMQENRQIDVDNLREKLVSLANKIRAFKKDSSMEILTNEEIELDRDLVVFPLALSKYVNQPSNQCNKITKNTVTGIEDYQGSKDFDSFIAKTGQTQNWSETDHLFFLKVRKNSQNIPSMVSAIRKKCPDLTPERIVNHEAWYKNYLDLREKQRNAIREWRENRDTKKREIIDKSSDIEKYDYDKNEGITRRESAANYSTSNPSVSEFNINGVKKNETNTNQKRELVKGWRKEKEKRNRIETEKSESEMESRRTWRENRRLARARAVKTAVLAYKEKKMENAPSSSTPSCTDLEQAASKSNSIKMIKCFRRQDEEFLKRRKVMMETKISRPHSASCTKVHSRSSIKTSTLLKPTKVWLEKCKAAEDSEREVSSQRISYVKYIPKLGTCNWRNRESR